MTARLTSVQKTLNTSNMPSDLDAPTARTDSRDVFKKWKHLADEIRDLPWSEVPAEMFRDYISATAGVLEKSYADNAAYKASQFIAIELASAVPHKVMDKTVVISGSWPAAGAQSTLSFGFAEERSEPLGTELTVSSERPLNENEVYEALQSKPPTRMVLDPFVSLPGKDLQALMRAWEDVFKNDPADSITDEINDRSLYCCCAHLLLWAEAEKRNAATTEIGLSGLTMNDEPLAEGLTGFIRMNVKMLDRSLDDTAENDVSDNVANKEEHQYKVSFKPS